jgi:hypothetical protein
MPPFCPSQNLTVGPVTAATAQIIATHGYSIATLMALCRLGSRALSVAVLAPAGPAKTVDYATDTCTLLA